MGQAPSHAKDSSQEMTEVGILLQELSARINLLPEDTYAFVGCPCRKAVGEASSGALNGTVYKDQWRKVGQQEAEWLSGWKQNRPRGLRATVSGRGCVVVAPAPLFVSFKPEQSWSVSAASTGVTGAFNTFAQASGTAALDKLSELRSKNPRVQLRVRCSPATVRLKDDSICQSVISHSRVTGGACAVFQGAMLGAELTVEFPGCRWGPEGGRSTLHDVIVSQQGGPGFKLPIATNTVDIEAIYQAMIAWSSQVEIEPSSWVALQVDVMETVVDVMVCDDMQDDLGLPSPSDDVTLAEGFLLNLKDPSQFKTEYGSAALSRCEKELGAAASAVRSAGAAAIAGQVVVRGLTEEGQIDFAICHAMLAEMNTIIKDSVQQEEQPPQEPQIEPEPQQQADEKEHWIPEVATDNADDAAPDDVAPALTSQMTSEELLLQKMSMDEHEAAVKLQATIRGKQARAQSQDLLKSKLAPKKGPAVLGILQPEGSTVGLVLDGQSHPHPINSTPKANIAQLSFGRTARICYSVSPESCDAIQYSFQCSTPLGPSTIVALVSARAMIETIAQLKANALVWRRVDNTRPEGEALLPLTDVDLLNPLRSEDRWELRLFAAEVSPGSRCAQIGGGLRCELEDVPTPETLCGVLDIALRNGSQPVLRRVKDTNVEAEEVLVVSRGDIPRLVQALAGKSGMESGDLPPRAPVPLELVSIYPPGPAGGASRLKMRLAQLQAYTIRVQVQSLHISTSDFSVRGSAHADFQAKIPFVCAMELPSRATVIFRCREVGPAGAGAWGEWTAPMAPVQ